MADRLALAFALALVTTQPVLAQSPRRQQRPSCSLLKSKSWVA